MNPRNTTTPAQQQQHDQEQHQGQENATNLATTTNDDTKNLPTAAGCDHTTLLPDDAVMTPGDMLLEDQEGEQDDDDISLSFLDEGLLLSSSIGADGADGTIDIRPSWCDICHDVLCNGDNCTSTTVSSTTHSITSGSGTPNLQNEQQHQHHHTTFVVAASAAPYLTSPPPCDVVPRYGTFRSSNVSSSSSSSATKRRADETSIASSVSSITSTSRPQGGQNNKKPKKIAAGHGTFVKNLFIGVNKFSVCYPEVAKWSTDGTKFLIFDEESFSNLYHDWNLSKSSDFAYIKKQLNIYGFQVQPRLQNEHDSAYLECTNPNFVRGKEYLLLHIKSARNTKNAAVQQLIDEALDPLKSEILALQQRVLELEINTSSHKLSLVSRSGLAFTSASKNQTLLFESALVEEDTEDTDTDTDTDMDSNSVVFTPPEKEEDNNKNDNNDRWSGHAAGIVDEDEIHEKFFDIKTFIHFLLFSFVLSELFRRVMM